MMRENKEAYFIRLSREIAYKGKVGRRREQFCIYSIRHKRDLIQQIDDEQNIAVKAIGKEITCRKGCYYTSCCMEYVDATVRECEAIVYYLYNHEIVLRLFVKKYKEWRNKVNAIEETMKTLEQLSFDLKIHTQKRMEETSKKYYESKIPCPFLNNNLCSIYEVRPYACSSYYVTTPLSQCHPDYLGEVKVTKPMPAEEITNTEFYYRGLERPVFVCMQKAVYEILEKGYFYLSKIPGLEGLEKEAISDKKVRNKYRKYVKPSLTEDN